jgi:hypothetical protein
MCWVLKECSVLPKAAGLWKCIQVHVRGDD